MARMRRAALIVAALLMTTIPMTFADTYFVYNDAGIPPQSDLFTWCDTPPCDVAAVFTCANPEGSGALRVNTNLWGGWGIFLQQDADLSGFDGGDVRFFTKTSYDLKVEFKCDPDPINMPGGATYTAFISDNGWDGSNAWQEISIPVCDFFPGGTCDAQCLGTVSAPFMTTVADLPFFNNFRIDHVRWKSPVVNTGASTVEVQGRQLIVNGEPFVVNGMDYAPIDVGENWQSAWRDRADRYLVDFPKIAASGANTVRLYAPITSKATLDAAWASGLHVIPTFLVNTDQLTCATGQSYLTDRFLEVVEEWKDHPAILFWLVGNEVNVNLGTADLCTEWYPQLDAMAAAAHAAEGASFHPVATANADSPSLGDICQPGCSDDLALPNVDLWAAQIYRGCDFGSLFSQYQKPNCSRPLVITEFGLDAWDGGTNMENQILQANCLETLLADADEALAVRTPGGVSSGQVVFSWADEWWKADEICGAGWEFHDGCTSFMNFALPDPNVNEEWWGVVGLSDSDSTVRDLRLAHERVGDAWHLGDVCSMDVAAFSGMTGNTDITFDPSPGSTDHTLHYGSLNAVSSYGYSGSLTGLGATGSSSVTLPSGSLFWVVVGRNNAAEGGYGTGISERPPAPGAAVPQDPNRSGQCSTP